MSAHATNNPVLYDIRVRGHLDDGWSDRVDVTSITREADGTTLLRIPVRDQAALHGVIARMRDLGIPVISVCPIDAAPAGNGLMQAVLQTKYGSADELQLATASIPTVGDREVLVRVRASAVDAGVVHLMTGRPYVLRAVYGLRRPKQSIPGLDLAGQVEAVGSAVTRFQPGDDVFGSGAGAYAEYAAVPEDRLAHRPPTVSWEQAAALGTSAVTALQALRDAAAVQPGQHVLVIGASGGVGSFAVQIAVALGARVTAVASTAKLDLVRSLGATQVVDYTREEITARGARFDVILDIAGNRPIRLLRRALAPDGTLVIVGGEGGGTFAGGVDRQLRARILSAFVRQKLGFLISTVRPADLEVLAALARDGRITPAVDRTFPLHESQDAIRHVQSGRARGKVVITV
ncbi:MAG: NAD(P)-dependent alcohol dehydrogenase [Dehalococcoidia bacterium]